MSMHRTELVNMIKVVRLLPFPELFARAYPLPKSAIFHCLIAMKDARDSQNLLLFLNARSTLAHMIKKKHESPNRASIFEEKADTSGKYSGGSDARDGDG